MFMMLNLFMISEAFNGHFCNDRPRRVRNFFFRRRLIKAIDSHTFKNSYGKNVPVSFFILENNGLRVGFFSLIYHHEQVTEIWLMGLIKGQRGNGLGSHLLSLSEKKARELYHPKTMFFVRSYLRSEGMITMLEQYGYEKVISSKNESGVWEK